MYKLCKTEQSAKRQRWLEAGLLEAMCVQQYEDISISDLCQRMGISRKSFYRYFSGKEGALQALLEHTLMEFASFLGHEQSEEITADKNLENFFWFWKEKKYLLDALERSNLTGMLIQKAMDLAVRETTLASRFLPGDARIVQEHMTRFCVCGMMTMMFSWHQEGYQQTPRQMANIAARLLTKPLIPDLDLLLFS